MNELDSRDHREKRRACETNTQIPKRLEADNHMLMGRSLFGSLADEPLSSVEVAVWIPSADLLSTPSKLRHAPSTAMFCSRSGRAWVASLTNLAWSPDLIERVDTFLASKVDSWSWQRMEVALSEQLELPVVLQNVLLDEGSLLDVVEVPRLVDAIFRRWISTQGALIDSNELRNTKARLHKEIEEAASAAIGKFLDCLQPQRRASHTYIGQRLDMYNYLTGEHARARRQFVADFPLLAAEVVSAASPSVWRELRNEVDLEHSPVVFLSKAMTVSPSTIRFLRGIGGEETGPHFQAHPAELIQLLDAAVPPEHRPRTPEQWFTFQELFDAARTFCGRSPAGTILVRSRLRHSMRHIVGLGRSPAPIASEEVHRVERMRLGMIQTIYCHCGAAKGHSQEIQRKASINTAIDTYLGKLSWKRLTELSAKWGRCYAEALENNSQAISFANSGTYWDHIPDGEFVAPNGGSVRCLLSTADLRLHGERFQICLAKVGFREGYHEECLRGTAAVFALSGSRGSVSSTASFSLSIGRSQQGQDAVIATLVQHTGYENRDPAQKDIAVLAALRQHFGTPAWQAHALEGIRVSRQRSAIKVQGRGISAETTIAGIHALTSTLGDVQAKNLLLQFSEQKP
jgi:hypothetical protein